MPMRPMGPCSQMGCRARAVPDGRGRCAPHAAAAEALYRETHPDTRPSSSQRGYGVEWKQIRASVLRAHRIPQAEWPLWDVDHSPRYDRAKEPDHRKYTLTPRLHGDHSRKTNAEDGGGWRRKER